jgi:hypothetical protein
MTTTMLIQVVIAVLTVFLEGVVIYWQQFLNYEVVTQYQFEVWTVFVFGLILSINIWKQRTRSSCNERKSTSFHKRTHPGCSSVAMAISHNEYITLMNEL